MASGVTANVASGSKITRSASRPGESLPFRAERPARAAVLRDIQREMSASWKPRPEATVQTADKENWTDEIPPQAAMKSLFPLVFRSGVLGEWSDTTRSMMPSESPCQRPSRLSRSRMGGAHLNAGLLGGMDS